MIDKEKATQQGINIIDSAKSSNALFEILQDKFPQVIKDGQVSLKSIAATLGLDSSVSNISGYELTFTGKGLANALYSTPCQKVLKLKEVFTPHCRNNDSFCHTEALAEVSQKTTQNRDFSPTAQNDNYLESNNPKNTIIIGDNLDALKILKSAYSEKIKMIYIDPPYNTANDNFIYPDNFREDYKAILHEVGLIEIDENGEETQSETLRFFKNIQSAKTHSGWLSFMLPRLKLARDLLKDDGIIFISIDDNEQANLKILCDEIFGEDNFVACMPRITKKAGKSTDKVANNHDYVLCYSKNDITFKQIEVNEQEYKEKDDYFEERGGYKLNQTLDYDSLSYSKNGDYEIVLNGKKYYAGGNYEKFLERQNGNFNRLDWVWRWRKDKLEFGLKNGFIEVRNNRIYTKTYFKCKITDKKPYKIEYIDRTKNVSSIELIENIYSNDNANKKLQEIFGQKNIFDYSKSVELIKFLVSQISTLPSQSDIILDFFAGSGTTAQAVMELNVQDNGNRQCILVQIDEPINEAKSKVAYNFCKNELGSQNPVISDITTERVRRAINKIAQSSLRGSGKATTKQSKNKSVALQNHLDSSVASLHRNDNIMTENLGFKVYTLSDKPQLIANEKGTLKLITNANLTAFDKALNLALQSGKVLDKVLETIIKDKLYKCEDSYYVIECDNEVLKNLAQTRDEYIYIDAYADINLEHFLNLNARFKDRLNVVY